MAFSTGIIWPLMREVKQRLSQEHRGTFRPEEVEGLRRLVGKLMKLHFKLAGTTVAAWLLAALALIGWAKVAPDLYPWHPDGSHRAAAWMILVAAPITMLWIYFAQERLLRLKIPVLFPAEALELVPPTFRINTLPRMLVVSLVIGCVPFVQLSQLALRQIHEIKAGKQSLENFLM